MRPGWKPLLWATLIAPACLIASLGQIAGAGDAGRFGLGRFFRSGNSGSSSSAASTPAPGSSSHPASPAPEAAAPATAPPLPDASIPALTAPANAPAPAPAPASAPRIIPRPRVARPITESDPIITRITLNRSDDGSQFGMFLQVYADGTILDSEGVHHVGKEALKPLIEALEAGDLYRTRGHCGAPATDYIESVQVVVYERVLGRLRASSFSYSGNPQGCDNAIRHLHGTLENLQAKITRPMSASSGSGPPAPPHIHGLSQNSLDKKRETLVP
jgi:hypothetical protein